MKSIKKKLLRKKSQIWNNNVDDYQDNYGENYDEINEEADKNNGSNHKTNDQAKEEYEIDTLPQKPDMQMQGE